jgi:hypothetical protein
MCKNFPNDYRGIIYATVINKSFGCDNFLNEHLKNTVINETEKYYINKNILHGFHFNNLVNNIDGTKVEVLFLKPFVLFGTEFKINNTDELKYLEVMGNILNAPEKVGRNGTTRSLFGEMIKFKLDKFPLLTTKRDRKSVV